MDRSRVESFAEEHLPSLMEFMGLGDWSIAIEMGRLDGQVCAMCSRTGHYRMATITFDADKLHNFDWLLDVMFHELAHCLLWPFDMYRDVVHVSSGEADSHREQNTFTYTVEMMVSNLEWLWNQHLRSVYLERRTAPEN